MKNGIMKRMLPLFGVVVLIFGANYLTVGSLCDRGILPLALVLSPLGCSESKQPDAPLPSASDARGSVPGASVNAKLGKVEHKVTFVELGSVNCIPCKMMQPVMRDIEREFAGQVMVVFHDVWTPQGKPQAMQYAIKAIPTQVFLDRDGKEYYRHVGFFPKEEVIKVLRMKGVN